MFPQYIFLFVREIRLDLADSHRFSHCRCSQCRNTVSGEGSGEHIGNESGDGSGNHGIMAAGTQCCRLPTHQKYFPITPITNPIHL